MGCMFTRLEVMDVIRPLHTGHQILCDLGQGWEEEAGVVATPYPVELPVEDDNRDALGRGLPLVNI
jgi:hypothetical protein